MAKKKDKLIQCKNEQIIIIIIMLILVGLMSLWSYKEGSEKGKRIEINIPNSEMIDEFCKSLGYDNGWLSSSSCEINEVQCHKEYFDVHEYKCIKWSK